eukprot:CAMPEP_0119059526 /NCGR_PEP_ID=MMETSP1178-20130426/3664_1 /TAXON_ID=33656 /ORGANISM="unid sp, Strain CCMP2000" /LENGTH=108 /DNA_ID=CAMNT_0007040567 /DNA_START=277 /DNA_END=603 /DNA_ORIENTATION=-
MVMADGHVKGVGEAHLLQAVSRVPEGLLRAVKLRLTPELHVGLAVWIHAPQVLGAVVELAFSPRVGRHGEGDFGIVTPKSRPPPVRAARLGQLALAPVRLQLLCLRAD